MAGKVNVFIDEIAKQALVKCDKYGIIKPSHREMFACGYREGIKVDSWHSVANGDLPKEGGMYLVRVEDYQHPVTWLWNGNRWDDISDCDKITHWMSIPELKVEQYNTNGMTKTRVPKGETYWFTTSSLDVQQTWDWDDNIAKNRFERGNYFHTKEEAESMARKLQAVLKGADVIEMPSEEEIYSKRIDIAYKRQCSYYVDDEGEEVSSYAECSDSAVDMLNWLKSKLIK